MMAEFQDIHPDEGTIHAWLDDALDATEAARVEAHVGACDSCAERVAEARGLIAGASRVVGLLDDQPLPLIRPATSPASGTEQSLWRSLRVTPARAAIAAALLVAVGISVTRGKIAVDSTTMVADSAQMVMSEKTVAATPPAMSPAPVATLSSDSTLSSAVAKRVAEDHPTRGISASAGVSVPQEPRSPSANVPTLNQAPAREVAAGRAEARLNEIVATSAVADKAAARPQVVAVPGSGCYRITSGDTIAARWAGMVLPAEIALSSTNAPPDENGGARYSITELRGSTSIGSWAHGAGDALSLTLRGAAALTSGTLTPERAKLVGSLSTRPNSASGAAAATAMSAQRQDDGATRSVRVVATRIDCPSR